METFTPYARTEDDIDDDLGRDLEAIVTQLERLVTSTYVVAVLIAGVLAAILV